MSDPTESRPFIITHCRVCDYDLRGLERPCKCPECGEMCNPSTIQVRGKGVVTRPHSTALGTAGALSAMLFGPLQTHFPFMRRYLVLFALCIGTAVILYFVWQRQRTRRYGGTRFVTFDARGVVSSEGPSDKEFIPWSRIAKWSLVRYRPHMLTWSKPLPRMWHLTFSSGSIFSITRQTGTMPGPMSRDRVYIDIAFEASDADVASLRESIAAVASDVTRVD